MKAVAYPWLGRFHKALAELWETPLAEPPKREGFLPDFDHRPKPPVFLVPGGVEAIISAWADALREDELSARPGKVGGDLRGKLLPLRPVSLMPYPKSGSLWMLLAVRIGEILDGILGNQPYDADRFQRSEGPLMEAFRRVKNSIGGGWYSNLLDRAPHMDPETWAIESEHVEQARMYAPRAWAEFLDQITAHAYRTFQGELPLTKDFRIVLPITNIEFNPDRVAELFGLFRIIRHPRLIFLLEDGSMDYSEMEESLAEQAGIPLEIFE